MKYITFIALSIALCLVTNSEAKARSMVAGGCAMQENVTMSLNFNGMVDKAAKVLDLVKTQENEIMAKAKDLGIEDIKIQSQNFSISMNNNNYGSYRYNGSISFKLSPYDKALLLLDELQGKYSNTSLNVNRYSQGNC